MITKLIKAKYENHTVTMDKAGWIHVKDGSRNMMTMPVKQYIKFCHANKNFIKQLKEYAKREKRNHKDN